MFTNYIIKDDILYLEIDVNYEFGESFKNKKNIVDEIKDYINKMKINLKKGKIVLTCCGVIIGSIILTNINSSIKKENITYIPSFKNTITFITDENSNEYVSENKSQEPNSTDDANKVKTEINNQSTQKNTISNQSQNNSSTKTSNTQGSTSNNSIPSQGSSNMQSNQINSGTTITIHRSNGAVITIDLEEYVIGVVAAEMPASFNLEALKAQSVLARTYALKAKSTGKTLTDTVSTQAYIDAGQMQSKWGSSYNTYYNKIKNAVENTKGQYLTYNGNYIEALYHSTNNGKTESSLDVFGNYYPYLISVTSDYDKSASSYLRRVTIDLNTISSKLGINLTSDSIIEVINYTDGNNIKEITIAGSTFTGKQVREALGLRSADFDISINGSTAIITTRGYGHGVGMSQYGANGMANAGYNYQSILSHYYPGTTLSR